MATAPLIIMEPVVASPAASNAAAHANDNIGCWTDDARVQLLLASCAARPPHGRWSRAYHDYGYGEAFRYAGYRVEALTAIRDDYGQRALAAYHAHGDVAYPQFSAWCRSISVMDAIDAAAGACQGQTNEGVLASDGQERLFVRHPANGCLLATEN